MTNTLITGGNKGLGYETARRLKDLGHTVIIGSRDAARGEAAAQALGVASVQLDVTSTDSVRAAAAAVAERFGSLDVLINNAGIIGTRAELPDVTGEDALEVFDTNTFSVVRTVNAFLPLLQQSDAPVVVNVSSGLGSFAVRADESRIEAQIPSLLYSASKAAMNMLTTIYAKYIPGVRMAVIDPGYTATDLNGHSGTQTVTEGTDAVVAAATDSSVGTGTFTDRSGVVDW